VLDLDHHIMKSAAIVSDRPKILWRQENATPSIYAYFDAIGGEFDTDYIASCYPYSGPAGKVFRPPAKDDAGRSYRFEGKGTGVWVLVKDHFLNDTTADLLAAADYLGGDIEYHEQGAGPGGIGAEWGSVWVPLLDGGIGVQTLATEDQYTNEMTGGQFTTIRGPRAFRALCEFLGFNWTQRKLAGEDKMPKRGEIVKLVADLLSNKRSW
jgi:hypothetical protein